MVLYILPETQDKFSHKVDLMLKHFPVKPQVEFLPEKRFLCQDTYHFEGQLCANKYYVNLVEVHIEDLEMNDWLLVADVLFNEGIMVMCNSKLYKDIPSQYGLDYMKCDYCGGTHRNRAKGHILHNKVTGQWMQVGSSCVDKMITQGRWLSQFCESLGRYLGDIGGCYADDFERGGWAAPNHHKQMAVKVKDAFDTVMDYRNNVSDVWKKPEYSDRGRKIGDGTNDFLMKHFRTDYAHDEEFFAKVDAYVRTFPIVEGLDWYGNEDFKTGIRLAFEAEYLPFAGLYQVWFGVKMYLDSLHNFLDECKEKGIEKDTKVKVSGKCFQVQQNDGFYGRTYDFYFKDEATGLVFTKECSSYSAATKFSDNGDTDGVFSFSATVKYIDIRRSRVVLGGRLSK